MLKGAVSHQKNLIERLKKSPSYQQEYIKASIEENFDMPEAILLALKDVAEARGYETFAKEAGLSQNALYKILDENKDAKPRFETIVQLFTALGLKITVEPIPSFKVS
jgi:probable addiction module antidote protein